MTPPTFLKFEDLKARRIVENWQTLHNWVARELPARSQDRTKYSGLDRVRNYRVA
jgi:hypothetical protein